MCYQLAATARGCLTASRNTHGKATGESAPGRRVKSCYLTSRVDPWPGFALTHPECTPGREGSTSPHRGLRPRLRHGHREGPANLPCETVRNLSVSWNGFGAPGEGNGLVLVAAHDAISGNVPANCDATSARRFAPERWGRSCNHASTRGTLAFGVLGASNPPGVASVTP